MWPCSCNRTVSKSIRPLACPLSRRRKQTIACRRRKLLVEVRRRINEPAVAGGVQIDGDGIGGGRSKPRPAISAVTSSTERNRSTNCCGSPAATHRSIAAAYIACKSNCEIDSSVSAPAGSDAIRGVAAVRVMLVAENVRLKISPFGRTRPLTDPKSPLRDAKVSTLKLLPTAGENAPTSATSKVPARLAFPKRLIRPNCVVAVPPISA